MECSGSVAIVLFDYGVAGALDEKVVVLARDLDRAERRSKRLPGQPEALGGAVVRRSEDDEGQRLAIRGDIVGGAIGSEAALGRNMGRCERLGEPPFTRRGGRQSIREALTKGVAGIGVGRAGVGGLAHLRLSKRIVLALLEREELLGLEEAGLPEHGNELTHLLPRDEFSPREPRKDRLGVELGVKPIEALERRDPRGRITSIADA